MRKGTVLVLLALLWAGAVPAYANSVVVPNSLFGTEGNVDNCIPFVVCIGVTRYQQVYASSQFTGSILITSILFRPDAVFGGVFSSSFSSVDFFLSTTSKAVNGLSATFSDNPGADNTLVRSGALAFSSSFTGPAGGPKDFDIVINLITPFLYNPSNGNLLLDVNILGTHTGFTRQFDATNAAGGATSRVYGSGTTGQRGSDFGLVTRFDGTAVPEPSSLVMLGVGLLLFVRRRQG